MEHYESTSSAAASTAAQPNAQAAHDRLTEIILSFSLVYPLPLNSSGMLHWRWDG